MTDRGLGLDEEQQRELGEALRDALLRDQTRMSDRLKAALDAAFEAKYGDGKEQDQ